MKIPIDFLERDIWLTAAFDLQSFLGQENLEVLQISLNSTCKIKRIFTMQSLVGNNTQITQNPQFIPMQF